MKKTPTFESASRMRKLLRRIGLLLMVAFVLITSFLGWVSDKASGVVHAVIAHLGLVRVEDWLKRRSVWFAFSVVAVMLVGFLAFKSFQIQLLLDKHFVRALTYGLIFKVVYLGTLNYLLHIFGDQFLEIRWIWWCFEHYRALRRKVNIYLKRSALYRFAQRWKERIRALTRRRSLLGIARRFVQKK